MQVTDWSIFEPEFKKSEFDCKETGKNEMDLNFMLRLLAFRRALGLAMIITSGFRDVTHTEEKHKDKPGYHTKGLACDTYVPDGIAAHKFVKLALAFGFSVGISQNPSKARFIHLDLRPGEPVLYSY